MPGLPDQVPEYVLEAVVATWLLPAKMLSLVIPPPAFGSEATACRVREAVYG